MKEDAEHANHCIERLLRQRQFQHVAQTELDIGQPMASRFDASEGKQVLGQIHSDDRTAFTDSHGGLYCRSPTPAANIQDARTAPQSQALNRPPSEACPE
jgi:hypothetical protein